MKNILLILARIAVGFSVAFLALYFFIISPHQQAEEHAHSHVAYALAIQNALQKGPQRLHDLISPSQIAVGDNRSSREYTNSLDSIRQIFELPKAEGPEPVYPAWRDKYINIFNDKVRDQAYKDILGKAENVVQNGHAFIEHHYAVMFALANMLAYDPNKDAGTTNPDALIDPIQQAQDGLAKTLQRLQAVPVFEDSSLGAVVNEVQKAETAAATYLQALQSGKLTDKQKSTYVGAVQSAQRSIISNRQHFWVKYYPQLVKALNFMASAFNSYGSKLLDLQNTN